MARGRNEGVSWRQETIHSSVQAPNRDHRLQHERIIYVDIALRNSLLVREALALEGWPPALAEHITGLIASGQVPAAGSDAFANLGPVVMGERKRASLDRLSGGALGFNGWAERMAGLKRATAGHAPTRAVIEAMMHCDFSQVHFKSDLNLAGFRFPGSVHFDGCRFARDFTVSGGRFLDEVSFYKAEFGGEAAFETTTFVKADFSQARFEGSAQFRKAEFDGPARFDRATFAKSAWFRGARFSSLVSFRNLEFKSDAALGSCLFAGDVAFSGTQFEDHAGFDHAEFKASAFFDNCHFHKVAWFKQARFATPPAFAMTRFAGVAHFDGVSMPQGENAVRQQLEDIRKRFAG